MLLSAFRKYEYFNLNFATTARVSFTWFIKFYFKSCETETTFLPFTVYSLNIRSQRDILDQSRRKAVSIAHGESRTHSRRRPPSSARRLRFFRPVNIYESTDDRACRACGACWWPLITSYLGIVAIIFFLRARDLLLLCVHARVIRKWSGNEHFFAYRNI